jgi:hypothetical protein
MAKHEPGATDDDIKADDFVDDCVDSFHRS